MTIKHPIEIKLEIAAAIHTALSDLFSEKQLDLDLDPSQVLAILERPPEVDLGDLSFPCFRFAKPMRSNPAQIALSIKEKVLSQRLSWIDSIELKGAFLNIHLVSDLYARQVLAVMEGDRDFPAKTFKVTRQKIMVEYSQPNTHKVFHIGHVRNVALGDSLARMLSYCGHEVIPVNYIGDEGTHIAECMWDFSKTKVDATRRDRVSLLEQSYVAAKTKIQEATGEQKEQFRAEVGEIHHNLEAKKGSIYQLWQETKSWCMEEFYSIYEWLNARFDHYFFESEMTELSQEIVDEYYEKGIFIKDDGAIGLDLEEFKLGFLMLRKTNGATLYATKDLALAKIKFEQYKIDRSIYVVAHEQNLHFQQVFKALELMGFENAKQCYHLSYAFVTIPDGKMSARKGNAVPFVAVRDAVIDKETEYLSKYASEWSKEKIDGTARKLALSAIRYGMLSMDPNKMIYFNLDEWTKPEGNTGPYLMYSYARTVSILKKGASADFLPDAHGIQGPLCSDSRKIIQMIADLDEVILVASESHRPSTLCSHLYNMCRSFNSYYGKVRILEGEPEDIRGRLALVQGFQKNLQSGLALLGIETVDQM